MNIDGFALVVGGGSGIGKACALAFAIEGAAGVLVADINLAAAEAVAAECAALAPGGGGRRFVAEGVHVDVTQESSVKAVTSRMVELFGRIDYCVNSAGVGVETPKEIADADGSEFRRFLDVNVNGTFLVTRDVSAAMRVQEPRPSRPAGNASDGGAGGAGNAAAAKVATAARNGRGPSRGAIVNLGSANSFVAVPGLVQYTTSKFAVLGLTKNAALDNAAHGIRVNCVCPSWVDTPMVRAAVDGNPALKAFIESAVPLGRMALPEEVADTVMFLCSPRSSYLTGSAFIVDGGTTLTAHASSG